MIENFKAHSPGRESVLFFFLDYFNIESILILFVSYFSVYRVDSHIFSYFICAMTSGR